MEPTPTVPPCGTSIFSSTPAAGEGTSIFTLSVSSSTSGSSCFTGSPTDLSQRAIVASVTDSPIAGTLIAMLIPALVPLNVPGEHRSGAAGILLQKVDQ